MKNELKMRPEGVPLGYSLTPCQLDRLFPTRSTSPIPGLVRFLVHFCLAYRDVGEERTQDAVALSRLRSRHFETGSMRQSRPWRS